MHTPTTFTCAAPSCPRVSLLLTWYSQTKFKKKSWFDKRNTTISLYNWLICGLIVISFSLSRSTLPLSEMFQSCSGPDNQWVVRQVDDGQGLYNSEPRPHGWAQLRLPRPGGTVHHFCSDYAYGRALYGAQTPARWQSQSTRKVGNHNAATEKHFSSTHIPR